MVQQRLTSTHMKISVNAVPYASCQYRQRFSAIWPPLVSLPLEVCLAMASADLAGLKLQAELSGYLKSSRLLKFIIIRSQLPILRVREVSVYVFVYCVLPAWRDLPFKNYKERLYLHEARSIGLQALQVAMWWITSTWILRMWKLCWKLTKGFGASERIHGRQGSECGCENEGYRYCLQDPVWQRAC